MIVIGICDGEQTVRSLLANYVDRYKEETNIVNLRYFHKMEESIITLTDGTQIPVSRNRRKAGALWQTAIFSKRIS